MMKKPEDRNPKTGRFLPGNRAALKHGANVFLITGRVPSVRGARQLKQDLSRIKKELEDITPDLNVKKQLLIDQIISSTGFLRLFEGYVKKAGIARPDKWKKKILDVQPGFSFYLSMMNRQLNAIQALGLDQKKADEILTPYEIVTREAREKEERRTDEHNRSDK